MGVGESWPWFRILKVSPSRHAAAIRRVAVAGAMCFCFVMSAPSVAFADGSLRVTVSGVSNANGVVHVTLYDNAADYPNGGFAHAETVAATEGAVTVTFEDLPPGDYALSVLHDEDEDGEVRTSAVGIPREGVGVSNNYLRGMRRPSFARSLFAHEGDTVVTVVLRYYGG